MQNQFIELNNSVHSKLCKNMQNKQYIYIELNNLVHTCIRNSHHNRD